MCQISKLECATILLLFIAGFPCVSDGLLLRFLHRVLKSFYRPPPPEAFMPTPVLIQHYNYPVESHHVFTNDGFMLEIFRIPRGKNNVTGREPVILQHGFMCSSVDWLLLENRDNLPFLLADMGYDVWLGNARGNNYSSTHSRYSRMSTNYWDFSFDEMGEFDIPAVIHHILNVTGRPQLSYVGHSMGTTMFFIAMNRHPDLQGRIRKMIALAPAVYVSRLKSPIGSLARLALSERFGGSLRLFQEGQVLPGLLNRLLKLIGPFFCSGSVPSELCKNVFYFFAGYSPYQTTEFTATMIAGHTPADASARTLAHFFQYIRHPIFTSFDFGPQDNRRRYGNALPLNYNLTVVKVPTMVMYGENDWLSVPRDTMRVVRELGNLMEAKKVEDPLFNHLDFTYAKDAKKLVYNHCINFLNS